MNVEKSFVIRWTDLYVCVWFLVLQKTGRSDGSRYRPSSNKRLVWSNIAGWGISIWHCGEVPVVHRGRYGSCSLALIWPQGPDYCPLIGYKPGLLLACLPDITPWEDIYMWWGSMITPTVGSVAPRGNLGAHFVWVWDLSLTQACTSGLFFSGPGGY